MGRLPGRHVHEAFLAGLVLVLVGLWTVGGSVLAGHLDVFRYVILPVTFVVPGLLATLVLVRIGHRSVRFVRSVIDGSVEWDIDLVAVVDTAVRLLAVLLAAYTLWWVIGSVYVLYVLNVGGVLLHPYVVLFFAAPLALIVIARQVVARYASPQSSWRA